MSTTTIVVPCFNEALRLPVGAFRSFASDDRRVEFLFVNDGSTDETGRLLESLALERPGQFRVLHLERNQGKAEAVRSGVLQVLDSPAKYVGYWDADLATPLEPIRDFRAVMDRRDDVDLVIGARIPLLGHDIRRRTMRRRLGRMFSAAASRALHLPVYDTQCGAKLFRTSPLTRFLFGGRFLSRWIFDVELLARMRCLFRDQMPVYEYPLELWTEVSGSKLRQRDFARATWELTRIWWAYLRPRRTPLWPRLVTAPRDEPFVRRGTQPIAPAAAPVLPRKAA